MSDAFDPYRQWLNITDPQRPPNHYVLLGLDLFESDTERIWNVSMNLMARVLEHDPGPHCEHARRVFDELEIARDCLCDPRRKQNYDAGLQASHAATASTARRKSWGRLPATDGSSVVQRQSTGRSDSSVISHAAVASDIGSSIGRRAEKPCPTEPSLPRPRWDERQTRIVAAVLAIVSLLGVIAYLALREPPEYNPAPQWARQLLDQDPTRRLSAARELKKLGLRSHDVLPQLVAALEQETNEDVRLAIAEALREAGPGVLSYSQQFETIAARESHPGVLQILNELTP